MDIRITNTINQLIEAGYLGNNKISRCNIMVSVIKVSDNENMYFIKKMDDFNVYMAFNDQLENLGEFKPRHSAVTDTTIYSNIKSPTENYYVKDKCLIGSTVFNNTFTNNVVEVANKNLYVNFSQVYQFDTEIKTAKIIKGAEYAVLVNCQYIVNTELEICDPIINMKSLYTIDNTIYVLSKAKSDCFKLTIFTNSNKAAETIYLNRMQYKCIKKGLKCGVYDPNLYKYIEVRKTKSPSILRVRTGQNAWNLYSSKTKTLLLTDDAIEITNRFKLEPDASTYYPEFGCVRSDVNKSGSFFIDIATAKSKNIKLYNKDLDKSLIVEQFTVVNNTNIAVKQRLLDNSMYYTILDSEFNPIISTVEKIRLVDDDCKKSCIYVIGKTYTVVKNNKIIVSGINDYDFGKIYIYTKNDNKYMIHNESVLQLEYIEVLESGKYPMPVTSDIKIIAKCLFNNLKEINNNLFKTK
jgi:hypothetical protein